MSGHDTRLEALFRRAVQDQLDHVVWQGMAPGGAPLRLSLAEGCTSMAIFQPDPEQPLKALSLEERRLLEQARLGGGLDSEQASRLDALGLERWRERLVDAWPSLSGRDEEPGPWEDADARIHVLLGDAGAGKSTLLRKVAVEKARRGLSLAGSLPLLPLYISLDSVQGSLEEDGLPRLLAAWWEPRCGLRGLDALFREALEEGRALVLLDGLDALPGMEARQRASSCVVTWAERWADRGNRFLVARRFIGHTRPPLPETWPRILLSGLPPDGVEQLACRVYEAREAGAHGGLTEPGRQRARDEARTLVEELRCAPRALAFATCPRALLGLVQLRRMLGTLPARVTDFYDAYVRLALEGREALRPALGELALRLRQHRPGGLVRGRELDLTGPAPERWEALVAEGGLLLEHGPGLWSFALPALCDFLAGQSLADRDAEERWRLLAPCLHEPHWREPLLMCAGLLSAREPSEADALVRRILHAGSEFEPLLHRDLLLATDVCLSMGGRVPAETLEALLEKLEDVLERGPRGARREALVRVDGLARLGHARARRCVDAVFKALTQDTLWKRWGFLSELEDPSRPQLRQWLDFRHAPWEPLMGEPPPPAEPEPEEQADALDDPARRQELLRSLPSLDAVERMRALKRLRPWASADAQVREALLARLHDSDSLVRWAALASLAALASSDGQVRSLLLHHLVHSRGYGTGLLARRLRREAASDAGLRDFLLRGLMHGARDKLRAFAAVALAEQVERDFPVRAALLARLKDEDSEVRGAAVEALARVSGDAQVREALLMRLTADENRYVREKAAKALASEAGREVRVRQALREWLERLPEEDLRFLGPEGGLAPIVDVPEVRQLLLETLERGGEVQRRAAALFLSHAAAADEALRQRMREWLTDTLPARREVAILVLGPLAKEDADVRRDLRARLDDAEDSVRDTALRALGDWADTDEAVRLALLEQLRAAKHLTRCAALGTMRRVLERCEPLRQAALARLDDDHFWVRMAAIHVLAPLVATDDAVYQRIRERWADPEKRVKEAVAAALAYRLKQEPSLVEELLPWMEATSPFGIDKDRLHEVLAPRLAMVAARDASLLERLGSALRAPEWERRHGAALVLSFLPEGFPAAWRPALRALLEDMGPGELASIEGQLSSEEVAEALLESSDAELREQALVHVLGVLEQARKPWHAENQRLWERRMLSLLSNHWTPLYRDERVLRSVLRILEEPVVDERLKYPREEAYEVLRQLASAPPLPGLTPPRP